MSNLSTLLHPRILEVYPPYTSLTDFIRTLPERFARGEGTCIYKGRNELRRFEVNGWKLVVKSFATPHIINRLVYGSIRASKAKRSCQYALLLHKIGIGSPDPVGYLNLRSAAGLLFDKSYLVTLESQCPYTYKDLFTPHFEATGDIVTHIARMTAKLHENHILHKDYSRGNILFNVSKDGGITLELIDLNRIRFGKVSIVAGCRNFERLPVTPEMQRLMATTYAQARGFDPQTCLQLMKTYRDMQPDKIDGKY